MDEGFSSTDPLMRTVAEVGMEVTAPPPPLTIIHNTKDVIDKKETSPPEKKGKFPISHLIFARLLKF
jgi:hypothetical protein